MAKIIAIGGLAYPLTPFFKDYDYIYAPDVEVWTRRQTHKLLDKVEDGTILIGFSKGVEVAMNIASQTKAIREVYLHSGKSNILQPAFDGTLLVFFLTRNDRKTENWVRDAYRRFNRLGYITILHELDPLPLPPYGKCIVREWMENNNHQFHNCIPLLRDRYGLFK